MKRILLILLSCINIGAILFYENASAETPWVYFTSMDYQRRAFTVCNENGCNYYSNGQWNETNMPNVIMGQIPYPGRALRLNGVTYQNNLSNAGDPNIKYNKLETIIRFKQQDGWEGNIFYSNSWSNYYRPTLNYQLSDNSTGRVQCIENGRDTTALEWRCEVATDNYKSFKSISIDYGSLEANSQSPVIAQMCAVPGTCGENAHQNNPNSLILETWRYRVESSADPLVAGQNTIIGQNQTIINQNQTIINQNNQINQNVEDIHDAITDSNVTGNFDVNLLQGFGPIAGIINGILGIPQTILQVNACSNISAPLPFVNNNLEIPCMGRILNDMAGGFITFADVILSAYLYFRLAMYIFRQVQQMRDPTNNKEDYLDL